MNHHTLISTQPTASGLPFVLRTSPSGPVGCVVVSEENAMVETTKKPSEVISDKAVDRLLADIAVDVDQSAAWAAKVVRERIGEPVTIDVYRTRTESRFNGLVSLGWRVSITSADACVFGDSFAVLNEAVSKSCLTFETQRRVAKQMAEADAADKADRAAVTAGPTNDATTDTLPLVKLGQGDYTREIRP